MPRKGGGTKSTGGFLTNHMGHPVIHFTVGVLQCIIPVLDVDDVRDGEDSDEPRSEVGALAPEVLRLLLHVHGVADVDLDLV